MSIRWQLEGRSKRNSDRRNRKRCSARRRNRLLRHEALEDRRLLAVYANGIEMPIPDPGTITSEIMVDETGLIKDLNVELTIEHNRAEDLDVYLVAPDGTRVELFTDVGGRGDNFTTTLLDDEGPTSIATASAPFTGTFRPEGDLSVVEGTGLAGTWTLEVTDDKRRESGVLKNWAISVDTSTDLPSTDFLDTNSLMLGDVHSGGDAKDVIVSDNGTAMAVWIESEGPGDSGPMRAVASEYDAATGTWASPVIISDSLSPYDLQNWLNLAGDGQGNYVATWQQESSAYYGEIWINRYVAGVGWQTPEIIGSGSTWSYDPEIAMAYEPSTGDTKAVVAWGYDNDNAFDVCISRLTDFTNGSWSTPELAENVADRVNPTLTQVDMAANGDFMIVFNTYDTYDLYYSHYDWDVEDWTVQANALETRPEHVNVPQIAMNSSGVAMVSWVQRTGEGDSYETWARRWNGGDWDTNEPELVANSFVDSSAHSSHLAIAENGESIALWIQRRDGASFLDAYVRHHDGTKWAMIDDVADITKLDTEDLGDVGASGTYLSPDNLGLAMDDTGNAVATWTQSDGTDANLWTTRFVRADSAWATAEKIEDAPLDTFSPVVDMNGSGIAQVLWIQPDFELTHVYASVVLDPSNLPPTAVDDVVEEVINEDASGTIDKAALLSNDTDPDGDVISITGFGVPNNGTLTDNGTSVTYTPNPDFHGTDTFTYTISDGNGGFDTANVTVTVEAVNDAPIAVDDSATTTEGTPVRIDAVANDSDVDGDAFFAELGEYLGEGEVVLDEDGSFTYTPALDFTGTDSFTYVAKDVHDAHSNEATVTITVDPDGPVDPPQISITDASKREGRTGKTTTLTFTVTRSGDTSGTTTINYATVDVPDGATGGEDSTVGVDYLTTSGTLTFLPGETTKTITVTVIGDGDREDDEIFQVLLTDEFGNEIAGTGTIINDDK